MMRHRLPVIDGPAPVELTQCVLVEAGELGPRHEAA
jgi:hypothetical protein